MSVLKNFFIALDQAVNCLIRIDGHWGWPDEMLSSRAWRIRQKHPAWQRWIDRIFFWDDNHCAECYDIERQRRQLPPRMRELS
jgi:hypothetical protein